MDGVEGFLGQQGQGFVECLAKAGAVVMGSQDVAEQAADGELVVEHKECAAGWGNPPRRPADSGWALGRSRSQA